MSILQGTLLDITTQDHTLGGHYIALRDFEMKPVYAWYRVNINPNPDMQEFMDFLIWQRYVYNPVIRYLEWEDIINA